MKNLFTLVVAFGTLVCSIASASVTNISIIYPPPGSPLLCYSWQWTDANNRLTMNAGQYGISGALGGTILTDTPLDPTITFNTLLNNDTSFSWTALHVTFSMNESFTIDSTAVANPGWTSFAGPVSFNGTSYVGEIDYSAGTPVIPGGILDFSYTVSFAGATSYSFNQVITVPEPSSLALLGLGLVGVAVRLRRKAA